MRPRFSAFSLLVPSLVATLSCAAVSLAGCTLGLNCTTAYHPNRVTVRFAPFSWSAGEWSFAVDDDLRCTVTLPGGAPRCSGGLMTDVRIDGATVDGVSFERAPRSFELVVTRDGRAVLRKSVAPAYSESEPNGEGCGVVRTASVDVAITP